MLTRSLENPPHFIRVLLPEGEPLILRSPPESLAELVQRIADETEALPQDIRLTFRDSQGARMMLVGEKRYKEALTVLSSKVLQMTVVLMPESSKSDTAVFHSRSVSDISALETEAANQKGDSQHAEGLLLDPKVELHRRVTSMLNNSMHYLSSKFKELLYILSTSDPDEVNEIDLREAGIGSYECILLSEIIELLPSLHSLNLESNTISNSGLSTLCGALLRHKSIKHLNLNENDLSAKGLKILVESIRKLGELELIAVARNRFNREDIETLIDAAPAKCRVHHDSNWSCSLM